MKSLIVGPSARKSATESLSRIADAVATTLGPKGMPFIFEKENSLDGKPTPAVTKDGLTVLKSLHFIDPVDYAVHAMCVQASSHTVLASGDGPQPLYSKVLTPKGFVRMENIEVGMKVCGTDGTIQEVLGVFPKGEKEIYEVEFFGGRVVECCSDHLWTVVDNYRKNKKEPETKTTGELLKNYVSVKENFKLYRYYTPRTAVEFYDIKEEMPIDPYLLGVLLGDGSLSGTGSIEISLGLKKEHIVKKLNLPKGIFIHSQYVDRKNYFRIKLSGRTPDGKSMADIIASIGLLGVKSGTKFIPPSYLYSGKETRERLMQGLVDTDGYVNSQGCVEFSSISEKMANDFVDLCRSLGKSVSVRLQEREKGKSYSMTSIYRMVVGKGRKHGDKIIRITPTGKTTKMQCIKVSNPNNLYITDGYITTHNTSSSVVMAAAVARAIGTSLEHTDKPQKLAREILKQAQAAITAIKAESDTSTEMARVVAETSANGDSELADVVLDAVAKSSAFGSIILERNPATATRYEVKTQDGLVAGRGYEGSRQLGSSIAVEVGQNTPFSLSTPLVLCYDGELHTKDQIGLILNKINSSLGLNFTLVVAAYEIGQEVINVCTQVNLANPNVKIWVHSMRELAETNHRWHKLHDLAAFTGATVLNFATVSEELSLDSLGTCSSITVSGDKSVYTGRSPKHKIPLRAVQNLNALEHATSPFDKEMIKTRNAELTSGLTKLIIGGGHTANLQERSDRADDAIKAAQACMKSGALPGCGASYIRAGELADVGPELKTALASIHEKIMENYGVDPITSFAAGETVCITDDGFAKGNFKELNLADSFETVAAVIKNGVELGVLLATLGGMSLTTDLQDIAQLERASRYLGGHQ